VEEEKSRKDKSTIPILTCDSSHTLLLPSILPHWVFFQTSTSANKGLAIKADYYEDALR